MFGENRRAHLPKEAVSNRSYFKAQLTEFFNALDPQLAKRFDLTLGKKGELIFVRDPISGIVKRERIMKKQL